MKRFFSIIFACLFLWDPCLGQAAAEVLVSYADETSVSDWDLDDLSKYGPRKKRKGYRGKSATDIGFVAGLDLGLLLPYGDMGKVYKMGYGTNLNIGYGLGPHFVLGLETGYMAFTKMEQNAPFWVLGGSQTYIPILGKATFTYGDEILCPYFGLGLGIYAGSSFLELGKKVLIGKEPGSGVPIYATFYKNILESSLDFGVSPFAGVLYRINNLFFVNAGLKMHTIFTKAKEIQIDMSFEESSKRYSHLSINVGLTLRLGK